MKEDTESQETQDNDTADDSRFEVKWKKKGQSSSPPPTPESGPATTAGDDPETLRQELDGAQARIRDLQDKWQRSSADLVNLRRRTEQEREDVEKFASMFLVAELLPVLDNFERALATIPGNLSMLTWVQGIMLIERHLQSVLEQRGLQEIQAEKQPFNPHFHEAIAERETDDSDPGTIVQVYQKGYTMHDRVIRPSLVELAKKPESAPDPAPPPVQPETTGDADTQAIVDDTQAENTGP